MNILNKTNEQIKVLDLAETQFNTGRFHMMDIVFRRWGNILKDSLYTKTGLMADISAENVLRMRFEKLLNSVEKQPIYIFETLNKSMGFLLLEKPFLGLILNGNTSDFSKKILLFT